MDDRANPFGAHHMQAGLFKHSVADDLVSSTDIELDGIGRLLLGISSRQRFCVSTCPDVWLAHDDASVRLSVTAIDARKKME